MLRSLIQGQGEGRGKCSIKSETQTQRPGGNHKEFLAGEVYVGATGTFNVHIDHLDGLLNCKV